MRIYKSIARCLKITVRFSLATVLVLSICLPAAADDYAQVLQYQVSIGRNRPVSTFYMSWRSKSLTTLELSNRSSKVRIPLYSSDPTLPTTAFFFMRASESNTNSFGDAVAGLFGLVIYVGAPVYRMYAGLKEMSDDIEKSISAEIAADMKNIDLSGLQLTFDQIHPDTKSPKAGH